VSYRLSLVSRGASRDFGGLGVRGSRRSTDCRDASVHLSRHEDDGRGFAKQLREELLEVVNLAHTVK